MWKPIGLSMVTGVFRGRLYIWIGVEFFKQGACLKEKWITVCGFAGFSSTSGFKKI